MCSVLWSLVLIKLACKYLTSWVLHIFFMPVTMKCCTVQISSLTSFIICFLSLVLHYNWLEFMYLPKGQCCKIGKPNTEFINMPFSVCFCGSKKSFTVQHSAPCKTCTPFVTAYEHEAVKHLPGKAPGLVLPMQNQRNTSRKMDASAYPHCTRNIIASFMNIWGQQLGDTVWDGHTCLSSRQDSDLPQAPQPSDCRVSHTRCLISSISRAMGLGLKWA